jgi:hypothetical protein
VNRDCSILQSGQRFGRMVATDTSVTSSPQPAGANAGRPRQNSTHRVVSVPSQIFQTRSSAGRKREPSSWHPFQCGADSYASDPQRRSRAEKGTASQGLKHRHTIESTGGPIGCGNFLTCEVGS